MAIKTQCSVCHRYYDGAKYTDGCPYCNKELKNNFATVEENKATVAMFNNSGSGLGKSLRSQFEEINIQVVNEEEAKAQNAKNLGSMGTVKKIDYDAVDDAQKTQAKYFKDKNLNPVTGWLVCISGENKGRSFEIHVGKNFVGRAMHMDISVNDMQISRDNHFSVVYDPKSLKTYLLQGNGITYYNGTVLSGAEELFEDDMIEAGTSKYVFIPYCREGRDWNE